MAERVPDYLLDEWGGQIIDSLRVQACLPARRLAASVAPLAEQS